MGVSFFARGSTTRRGDQRRLATLAYQVAMYLPGTRAHIVTTVLSDPGRHEIYATSTFPKSS